MNNFYCRLEGFYQPLFDKDLAVTKQDSILLGREVYVKEFNDIKSLKQQIKDYTQIWITIYPEKERYLSNKKWKNNRIKDQLDEKRDRYPGFMILNSNKDWVTIGYCYRGWHFIGNEFSKYINKYIINLHGIDRFIEYRKKLNGRNFLFLIPEVLEEHERALISDELMDLELEHFLEGKEITEKIEQEVFYPEMVRRGYIDILNEN